MITDWQIERRGEEMLLGLAVEHAALDIVTHRGLLTTCLAMLKSPHVGAVDTRMGQFGDFPVTLNLFADDTVSIFVDGPYFTSNRCQSAAIWFEKDKLEEILREVLRDA